MQSVRIYVHLSRHLNNIENEIDTRYDHISVSVLVVHYASPDHTVKKNYVHAEQKSVDVLNNKDADEMEHTSNK